MYSDSLALKRTLSYVFYVIVGIKSELFHWTSRVVVAMKLRYANFEIGSVKIWGVYGGVDEASLHLGCYAA